jgi:type IV pilus assembly protein PilQ
MFTIRLREKRPYNVLEEENGVRVSVLLPETPPEIPLLPPPTLPETEGLAEVDQEPPAEPEPPTPEKEMKVAEAAPPEPVPAPQPQSVTKGVPHKQGLYGKDYRGKKISLDFKDADIQNVLRLIAEVSNKNIVISDAVKGKVTIRLLNVPWDMALDVILKTYALEKEELGPNILRVAPYTQLKREREDARKAEEALERVETLETRLVPVNYAKAKDLESVIGRLKSKRPDATILVDTRTNSLIIRDIPLNINEMVGLVQSLDTQTPQVLIEAKIVELDVNFERELGIQWGTQFNAGPATGNPTGLNFPNTASIGGVVDNISGQVVPGIANPVVNLPAAVDSSAGGALGFSLASITNSFQLDAQLSALEKRNHARILSSPRVATLSNQEARINQGQEVPYQTTSDEGTKTEFKEAVLALSVTPQITFDRSIIMNILVTNDTPIRDPTVGFIIGTKEARTTVLVKDGDTAVIGGIYTNNDAESLGGVPPGTPRA